MKAETMNSSPDPSHSGPVPDDAGAPAVASDHAEATAEAAAAAADADKAAPIAASGASVAVTVEASPRAGAAGWLTSSATLFPAPSRVCALTCP